MRDQTEAISPLHVAARNGHTAVIEALLDFGMSVNVMVSVVYTFLLSLILHIITVIIIRN